jgi:ATP-dependent DNA helicase RecG
MQESNLLTLIQLGEGISVEFKKSTSEITKDVYDTVCSFSNRDGGHIFLGVQDDGTILGVNPDAIPRIKKDFVTAINNAQKFYPPLYLQLEQYELEGKPILYVYVPSGSQVCRHRGRIFDRSNESDIDITDNTDLVYQLYARKSGSYFVNKVTHFNIEDLRSDLIERARLMTSVRNANHPWRTMSDEELLRSAGLILRDENSRQEGITIAAILLFGKDSTILSVLPQHKTDAIFRIENLDRYDDRDVIITNLLETYDRLIDFGHKHLSDPFVMEGVHSVSARDKILREIFSNSLAHRDYSSGYVAKFVIEQNRLYTENANRSHGSGPLNLSSFEPYAKNPPISKVFREIGLADELGSGMRNTYKYTKLYSGGTPEFVEGDIFRTIVPLNEVATAKVGPVETQENLGSEQASEQASEQVSEQVIFSQIASFCATARTKREICQQFGYHSRPYFTKKYLLPMIDNGYLTMTNPDKPNSPNQKYISANHE